MVLNINGRTEEVSSDPETELLNVLRNELDLTGSKYGCGEGACGACMVLIDGQPTPSCVTPLRAVSGKAVLTIEALEKDGKLHRVQEAFLETDPFQCSYCASGMIMSAVALLKANPSPNDAEIVDAMNRNICRCGTYHNIIKAIKLASKS